MKTKRSKLADRITWTRCQITLNMKKERDRDRDEN